MVLPYGVCTKPRGSAASREAAGVRFASKTSVHTVRPCPACSRNRSTTFWSEEFTVPDDVVLAATAIDTDDYPGMFRSLSWIVWADLAQHVRPMKFTNVKLSAAFANS